MTKLFPALTSSSVTCPNDGSPAGTFTDPSFVMRTDLSGRGIQQGGEWGSPAAAMVAAKRQRDTEISNRASAGQGFPLGRPSYYVATRNPVTHKFDIEYVK